MATSISATAPQSILVRLTVPAGSLITALDASYTYTAQVIAYPPGDVNVSIQAYIKAGGMTSQTYARSSASSLGVMTVTPPMLVPDGQVEVYVMSSIYAPGWQVTQTSSTATIQCEPSVLVLPMSMPF